MSENVGASTSLNPKDLHGLYRDNFTFLTRSNVFERTVLKDVIDSVDIAENIGAILESYFSWIFIMYHVKSIVKIVRNIRQTLFRKLYHKFYFCV
jgi:hypothetical protein